ncbi:hypothetical protein CW731_00235 [Polaribacter sp. ALD11]|uniref:hypothetical protein n=1 Tax=Polaribacter sp. ALD11 TaxID=2058137 RepID=UPI000C30FB8A|nr:hypothetical protein [Polaribacter sp. ALD11]AUC83809.1 hypothetical protein CW731_00235 [Polaribacter sp. ALD11]
MKKLQLLFILAAIAFSTKAQDIAMSTQMSYNDNFANNVSDNEIIPLLNEATYTYKYKGDNVLVIFSEDEHIEYFNDKKYFIKSSIEWTASDECYMTLQESNLPDFPFKRGIKLHMRIIKVKRGYIHYESTLGGRSWTGKMKQLI